MSVSKPRVADIRLVASLLQEEADSVEDLAREVIIRLDEARIERAKREPHLGLLFRSGAPPVLLAVGPFGTPTQLTRWASKQGLTPESCKSIVIKRPEEV